MSDSVSGKIGAFIGGLVFAAFTLAIALIPLWTYLLVRNSLDPQTFWQKFLVLGVGVYLLGGLQIVFLIIWAVILANVFSDQGP